MPTQAQIDANRRNAQKSTGPRTAAGKAVVSRNAVKHGLFTDALPLPGEELAEFQAFADAIVADLAPVGMSQLVLAKRIAQIQWKLERMPRIEAAVMADIAGAHRFALDITTATIIGRELDIFLRYQLYEQRLERSCRAYMKEYRQLKKEQPEDDQSDHAAAEAADALNRYLAIVQDPEEDGDDSSSDDGTPSDTPSPDDNASATPAAASAEPEPKKQTQFQPNTGPDNELWRQEQVRQTLDRIRDSLRSEYARDHKREDVA